MDADRNIGKPPLAHDVHVLICALHTFGALYCRRVAEPFGD